MFERFTETARKAIFCARYEATQSGSAFVEAEHLLLGILRPDIPLTIRLLGSSAKIELIRDQIGKQAPVRTPAPTPPSVDVPLSHECKRALAYGAEEAEKLRSPRIELEHLLLGLSRETSCFAAKIMRITDSLEGSSRKRRSVPASHLLNLRNPFRRSRRPHAT